MSGLITRSRWLGTVLVMAMVLSGYVFFGYTVLNAVLYLLDRAAKAGW